MIEKTLRAGNIATAFAFVATAADMTFTGGVGTAIGAALSGVALFKTADKKTKTLAQSMAKEMQGHLDRSQLTDGRKKIAVQMLEQHPPCANDLANGNMDAKTIATNMRVYVKDTAKDPAHKTEIALKDYADTLAATLAPVLEPGNMVEAMLQELLARSDESGEFNRLKNEGITEKTIIQLAQRIAGETDDLGQAWLTLQDAMDTAVKVQQEGRIKSNHGDFVDTVLARVAELARTGEYSDASREIDAALVEEEAAHARRKDRLLTSGVELARLDGDATRAAALLLQQADLAAGGQAEFKALRDLRRIYYETGRDKGTTLDLSISIEIAQLVLARANTPDERGVALNDLGNALAILGERETGIGRLQDAVTAYENALKENTRERVPLEWAMTKGNLVNLERALFDKTGDAAHLERGLVFAGQAKEVFEQAQAGQYMGMIDRTIARISALRDGDGG